MATSNFLVSSDFRRIMLPVLLGSIERGLENVQRCLKKHEETLDEYYLKEVVGLLFEIEANTKEVRSFLVPEGVEAEEFLNDWLNDYPREQTGGRELGTLVVEEPEDL